MKKRTTSQIIAYCERDLAKLEKDFREKWSLHPASPDAIENLARQSTLLRVKNYANGHPATYTE